MEIDKAVMYFGYFVLGVGGGGIACWLSSWALDKFLDAFNSKKIVLQWYAGKMREKRDAKK